MLTPDWLPFNDMENVDDFLPLHLVQCCASYLGPSHSLATAIYISVTEGLRKVRVRVGEQVAPSLSRSLFSQRWPVCHPRGVPAR